MLRKLSSPLLAVNLVLLFTNLALLRFPDQVATPSLNVETSNIHKRDNGLGDKDHRSSKDLTGLGLDYKEHGSHHSLAHEDQAISRNPEAKPKPKPTVQYSNLDSAVKRKVTSRTDDYVKSYSTPKSNVSQRSPEVKRFRSSYMIPEIQHTKLVNCAAIFKNDKKEIERAKGIMSKKPKVPIYEETYLEWTRDCESFKKRRGYIEYPLSEEEENFPLAFSLSMFKDVEHVERLLRSIYQPQNLYCIHIDIKSSLLIHRTMQAIANCFDNVFIASRLDKIKWGDVSVLLPALNCMRDLVRDHWGKWKYYINLAGQEFPLRSNYELVRIAKIFNGSNDIGGSVERMEMDRVNHYWTHRWSKTYQQTIFYDTFKPKPRPPFSFNLTFYKGELHGLFSQNMVRYVVTNQTAKKYLEWCWDTGHASEHYWNVLNYNKILQAPGGYNGPLNLAEKYSYEPAMRAKHWIDQNYEPRKCEGQVVRGICVFGIGDMPWLATRNEMFANKFYLTYQHLALDCLEELHRNKTKMGKNVPFPGQYYRHLPTAVYGRKDGLLQ